MNNDSIIIDNDLILDVNTGIIGQKNTKQSKNNLPIDELISEIDKLEVYINDLESSTNPRTTSYLSQPNREGVYKTAGLLTNIVLGIMIALLFIILLI